MHKYIIPGFEKPVILTTEERIRLILRFDPATIVDDHLTNRCICGMYYGCHLCPLYDYDDGSKCTSTLVGAITKESAPRSHVDLTERQAPIRSSLGHWIVRRMHAYLRLEGQPMPEARLDPWREEDNRLFGFVFGHPRLPDGRYIRTAPIARRWSDIIATYNTVYTLGEKEEL